MKKKLRRNPASDRIVICRVDNFPLLSTKTTFRVNTKTILTVMKLVAIFLLTTVIQLSAKDLLYAQRVTLSLKDVPLEKVFRDIRHQTGIGFLYTKQMLHDTHPVSIEVKNASLKEALGICFLGQPIGYSIINGAIVINRKPKRVTASSKADTTVTVQGQVSDEKGEPLIGVSIQLKGTNKGTITDANGHYALAIPNLSGTLIFSYIGFDSREITLNGERNIDVVMKPGVSSLEQMVVIGYGVQKKKNLTGAVSTIPEKDIQNRSVTTLAKALQGADPSLNITYGTGIPDQGYGLNVRGTPSINGGSPLILMDGIEVNLNEINPHDIATVTILKDAAASAIYGAKASSGVVLITTKEGKDLDGRSVITYEGRFGTLKNTTSTDYIRRGYDYVDLTNRFYKAYKGYNQLLYDEEDMQMLLARRNDINENPKRPWTYVDDQGKYYYYGNTDWYGYFYRRQRPQQEHNISASGGNNNVKYYVSGRYLSQDGIFNIYHDNYKNYSFYAKIDAAIKPWLKYTGSASYNNSVYMFAGMYNPQYTIRALQTNISPSFIPRNPDGSIVEYTNQFRSNSPIGAGHGGFLTANDARNSRGNKYMILSNRLDFTITKHLSLTGTYAYKHRERRNKYRNMPFDYSRQQGVFQTIRSGTIYDYLYKDIYDVNDHNLNLYTTYDNTINDIHKVDITVGSQYESYRDVNLGVNQLGQLSRDLGAFSLGTGEITLTNDINTFRTLGFFGRLNYSYKEKYLLQMSGRYDGTSRFASNDRWGFFPSMALGWILNKEKFWRHVDNVFSFAKLRFSYGSLGNQQVGYYAYIDEITPDHKMDYTFDGKTQGIYASVSNPKSPSLTWETVTTYNIGLDLQSLNNRLSLSGDVFIRDTKNMLAQSLTLPAVFGAPTPLGNVANLETKGYEIKVSWEDNLTLFNKHLHYNVSATLGNYSTVITKFHNPDKLISDWYVGRHFGDIWGYTVKGLFSTDDEAAQYQLKINDKAVNHRVYASKEDNFLQAGDVEFIDLNGDGSINQGSGTVSDPGDKTIIGNSQPKYNYSVRVNLDWFNIDLSIFLQGVGKRNWWPSTYSYNFWGPYSYPLVSFISKDFLSNTWSEDNPDAYFPRPRGYQSYSDGSLGVANDRYLQNVAYLRLKSLVVGYSIPFNNKFISKARIYFSGENLCYWSELKKHTKTVDPELTVTGATYNANSGVGYPFSKSFNFGVRLTF